MYTDSYSEEITRKLAKLKKKDPAHYDNVDKKIHWILTHPKNDLKIYITP